MSNETDKPKYDHAEAFCLMLYQCNDCRKLEFLYNTRDGVTPFGIICKHCGGFDALHVAWGADVCIPNWTPPPGTLRLFKDSKEVACSLPDGRKAYHPEIDNNGVQVVPPRRRTLGGGRFA